VFPCVTTVLLSQPLGESREGNSNSAEPPRKLASQNFRLRWWVEALFLCTLFGEIIQFISAHLSQSPHFMLRPWKFKWLPKSLSSLEGVAKFPPGQRAGGHSRLELEFNTQVAQTKTTV
jgi:hypothetical protein